MAQNSDSTIVYRDGLIVYPSGQTITVQDYMKWIETIPDPATRIAKKERLLELMKL
jgi:hypothetical protein